MAKLSEKNKMRLMVGTLLLTSTALLITVGVMLPKLNKQEKAIKDVLAKG